MILFLKIITAVTLLILIYFICKLVKEDEELATMWEYTQRSEIDERGAKIKINFQHHVDDKWILNMYKYLSKNLPEWDHSKKDKVFTLLFFPAKICLLFSNVNEKSWTM